MADRPECATCHARFLPCDSCDGYSFFDEDGVDPCPECSGDGVVPNESCACVMWELYGGGEND